MTARTTRAGFDPILAVAVSLGAASLGAAAPAQADGEELGHEIAFRSQIEIA